MNIRLPNTNDPIIYAIIYSGNPILKVIDAFIIMFLASLVIIFYHRGMNNDRNKKRTIDPNIFLISFYSLIISIGIIAVLNNNSFFSSSHAYTSYKSAQVAREKDHPNIFNGSSKIQSFPYSKRKHYNITDVKKVINRPLNDKELNIINNEVSKEYIINSNNKNLPVILNPGNINEVINKQGISATVNNKNQTKCIITANQISYNSVGDPLSVSISSIACDQNNNIILINRK